MASVTLTRAELSAVLALALPDPPPAPDPSTQALAAALAAVGCTPDQTKGVLDRMKPAEPAEPQPTLRERLEAMLSAPSLTFSDTRKDNGEPVNVVLKVTP